MSVNSDSELLTGNDLQDHLDLLMPSDSPQNNSIQSDLNDSFIETTLSNTSHDADNAMGISGNDFTDHLDSLTGDDSGKLFMNTDTSDDLHQDLLSMSDEDLAAPPEETLNGNDFASHMDSLLNTDNIQPGLQSENDFDNIINIDNNEQNPFSAVSPSDSEGSDDSFLHDMTPELQTTDESLDNSLTLDPMISGDTSQPDSSATIHGQTGNSVFGVESGSSPENGTMTGDDFANHMDMLLGDEDTVDQSIYNKISSAFDTDISIPARDSNNEMISGDDIANHLDSLSGDLQSALIEEPDETSRDNFGAAVSENDVDLKDDNVSGDDIADKIDIISGDFSSNQPYNTRDTMHQFSNQQDDLLEIPDEQLNGSDVSDRIGALENEPFLNIDQIDPDTHPSDTSPFTNTEFEETMQIDRSFIENVQSPDSTTVGDDKTGRNNQVPPSINPFEFENETIQIDRSELFTHQTNAAQNDNESLILDIENPTPNHDALYVSDDIHIDQDEQSISEMDVLVEPSKDIQNVTGEDVIDKLDNIFTSSNFDQETPPNEYIPNDIYNSDALLETAIDNGPHEISWPQKNQPGSSHSQNNDNVTGNDVEQRLDELFSDGSEVKENKNYQEAAEELEISDDYQGQSGFMMTELENSMDDNEAQGFVDNREDVNLSDETGVQSAFSASIIDDQSQEFDSSAPLNGIDTRDKPYSIPDHVLTPTLADIYFQQGQYQLALQIYSRLIEKEPSNIHLQDRYDQIQAYLSAQENQPGQFFDFGNDPDQSKGKRRSAETDKPLSGVRIKKNKKPKK